MNTRLLIVSQADVGRSLTEYLGRQLHISPTEVERLLSRRLIRVNGTACSNADWRLRLGQRVEITSKGVAPVAEPAARPPRTNSTTHSTTPQIHIRFVDSQIVVAEKPIGLTTMRHAEEAAEFGTRAAKYLPVTMAELLPEVLREHLGAKKPIGVRAVHRLDKDTTGLVIFARTPQAEGHLGTQFRNHKIERKYRAIVRGLGVTARIESNLIRDRGDGRRGSGNAPGQRAVTHVRLIEALGQFSIVECELETGRTHQVRIHLGEAGTPLCGERIYDRPIHGKPYADGSKMTRPALHAATLGVEHPTTGETMRWESDLPKDMRQLIERLRERGQS
jgi:23S rRNA pseudouridine1911/1915/1917 synthase